jgi:DNA-binding CsgD family transcriptional regulator
MYTHLYFYFDSKGRIHAQGRHRGNKHSEAEFAYHEDLKNNRRLRERCDSSSRTQTCGLLTSSLTAEPHEYIDDLFILACSESALTDMQITVMLFLRAGKSNKQLMELLGIGVDGVKTHLRNIYAKLGVHSRGEAVAKMEAVAKSFRYADGADR